MKYLILYLLFFSNFSFSQIEIYNLGLTDTTQKVMYEYHENEFKIYGITINSTFTLMHGKDSLDLYYGNSGNYYLRNFHSKCDTLKLYKDGVLLNTAYFEQKSIPKLNFHLGDIRDSLVTTSELIFALEEQGIFVTFAPEFAKCEAVVTNVGASYIEKSSGRIIKLYKKNQSRKVSRHSNWSDEKWIRKNENDSRYLGRRNSLSVKQISKVKKMKSGDILFIQLVKISCYNCTHKVHAVNLEFKIK